MNRKLIALIPSLALATSLAQAQTTTWTNLVGDGQWNTAENWDAGVPTEGVAAVVSNANTVVSYSAPMAATSFGSLVSTGQVNVNATAFALTGSGSFYGSKGLVMVNSGGAMSAGAGLTLGMGAGGALASGGSLSVTGNLNLGNSSTTGNIGFITNNGGFLDITGGLRVNANNASSTARAVIKGGTNNLGAVVITRSSSTGSFATAGTEGLYIQDGLVNMTSLDVGGNGNSYLSAIIAGGTVTNAGETIVRQVTASRASRFLQTGGLYIGQGTVNVRGQPANNSIMIYAVTGGTNILNGIALGNPAGTDVAGTIRITNAAKIFLGSAGMTSIGSFSSKTIVLNSGSILGAQADWTGTEPLLLAGGIIQCASLDDVAHNITISGSISGAASTPLIKTGAGTLTLDGANLYSGHTVVDQGTLAIGPSGALASSQINLKSGTILDVTSAPGFVHSNARVLAGWGNISGMFNIGAGGIINPGSNVLSGTLTFSNGVTEQGGAINHFDLSADPNGADNDRMVVNGDIVLLNTNTIEVLGTPQQGSAYTLIQYTGSFIGDLDTLLIVGAGGTLSHDPIGKKIHFTATTLSRSPTSMVWLGNPTENVWDVLGHTNWLNTETAGLDSFIQGDTARFTSAGAVNPVVDLVGSLLPASVIFDSTTDYTLTGAGAIGGTASLIKTNTGKLTLLVTNTYTGPTVLAGGKVEVAELTAATVPGTLGAADASAANLVFDGGTLGYTGPSVTFNRGMLLQGGGGTLAITDPAATLQAIVGIEGPGKLVKTGAGTLDVRAPNTFTGGTDILEGRIRIDRDTAATLGTNVIALKGTETTPVSLAFAADSQRIGNPLHVSGTNNFVVNASSANDTLGGEISGTGTMILQGSAGRTITLEGNLSSFTGQIIADGIGNVRLFPSLGGAGTLFDLGPGSCILNNRNGGVTIWLGALIGASTTRLEGGSNNDGNGRTTTYIVGGRNTPATFDGVIAETSPLRRLNLVKEGSAPWTLTALSAYTGTTTVSNGVLALSGPGAIDNTTNLLIVAPGQVDVSARYDTTLNIGATADQTLEGNGSITGSLYVGPLGTVKPGLSVGTLTLSQSATLMGKAIMELNRTASPNSDRLAATSIALGGELIVANVGGSLHVGDTFDLFNGALSGAFTSVVLPVGYTFNTDNLATEGTITVLTVPTAPAISGISVIGGNLVISATGGVPNSSASVLGATDVALPAAQWTVAATGTFDANGNLVLSIPIDSETPQKFFRLQMNL